MIKKRRAVIYSDSEDNLMTIEKPLKTAEDGSGKTLKAMKEKLRKQREESGFIDGWCCLGFFGFGKNIWALFEQFGR